jgi:hypothetical protein
LLDQHICQRTFFDALDVAKGPSLGTNFTLACPYTLLAHYHELDFAMEYNVQPNLLRVSVGLESFDCLKDKFDHALSTSRLHPKIVRPAVGNQQTRSFCSNAYCRDTQAMLSRRMSSHGTTVAASTIQKGLRLALRVRF